MMAQPFVPSEAQVREAKFVSDQVLLMLMLVSQQKGESPEGRQNKEQLLKRYQQLSRMVRKAAKHHPALMEEWEQQEQGPSIRTFQPESSRPLPEVVTEVAETKTAPIATPEPEPAVGALQLAQNLGATRTNQGEGVQLLQCLLLHLGFKVKLTGVFDPATTQAVKTFQMKKNLPITGWIDPKTHGYLSHILSRLNPDVLRPPDATPNPQTEQDAEEEWSETLTLDLGPVNQTGKVSTGPQVLLLQELLLQQGYTVVASGDYDKDTLQAVRAFQSAYKLPVTGTVDTKTREKLNHVLTITYAENTFKVACFRTIFDFRQQQGLPTTGLMGWQLNEWFQQLLVLLKQPVLADEPLWQNLTPSERILLQNPLGTPGQAGIVSQGPEVACLQELLQQSGLDVDVNAAFDLKTFTALKQWQTQHHLTATGSTDAATRHLFNQQLQARYAQEDIEKALFEACLDFQNTLQIKLSQSLYPDLKAKLHQLLHASDIPVIAADLGPSNRPGKVSKGSHVVLLQMVLAACGHNTPVNGQYDQALYNEVRQYQKAHALPMTGMIDEKTKAHLNQTIETLIEL